MTWNGTLDGNQSVPTIFHLEDMIDVDSFRIRFIIDIIQEWFQAKEFFMEHLKK